MSAATRTVSSSLELLRQELDSTAQENRQLKGKIEKLYNENVQLKKALYELTNQLNQVKQNTGNASSKKLSFLNIDSLTSDEGAGSESEETGGVLLKLEEKTSLKRISSAAAVSDSSAVGTPSSSSMDSMKSRFSQYSASNESKVFNFKTELQGHKGAVYNCAFSPCGQYLLSTSFDKTIKIWDVGAQQCASTLRDHQSAVLDAKWSTDCKHICSGGVDKSVKFWDAKVGKLIRTFKVDGFSQCTQFKRDSTDLIFSGDTRKNIMIFDTKSSHSASGSTETSPTSSGLLDSPVLSKPAICIQNDSMVNSIQVYNNATYIMSGDNKGNLKLWDYRNPSSFLLDIRANAEGGPATPISHLALSGNKEEEEAKYLAVNSFDNVIRIYDRRTSLMNNNLNNLHLVHELKGGHKNSNWPIKSSFSYFTYKPSTAPSSASSSSSSSSVSQPEDTPKAYNRMLLATGSVDAFVYVYEFGNKEGFSEVIQKLDGHNDIVYGVDFHPFEHLLASCSGDSRILLFKAKTTNILQ